MLGALAVLAGAVGDAHSQANLVSNGHFTANAASFGTWPGYTGGANAASITGWNNLSGGGVGVGVNGAGVSFAPPNPFGPANDGGNTYAFIQSGTGELAQSLSLAGNRTYKLEFDAAARSGNTTVFRVQIGDNTQVYVTSGNLNANNAAFTHYSYTFTTPGTFNGTPSIQLYNLTAGDNTVDFANVSVSRNLINFDDVADGTMINTHYAGVTFTNPIGGNVFAKSGLGFAPSPTNVVCVTNGGSTFPFFDALYGAVDAHFSTPMRTVSIDVRPVGPIDSFLTPLTKRPFLQAFDAAGNYLGVTVYYQGALPTNCCYDVGPVETLTITLPAGNIGIARFSSQYQAGTFRTYGLFDNLRYDDGYYNLTVSIVGSGNVLTSPFPGPYSYGSVVTLGATPSQDWSFSGWSGDFTSTANPVLPIMNSDKTVIATFVPAPQAGPNFVVTTTDDHDDGIAGVSDCTLREAINAANANANSNTITFAPGVTGRITLQLGELVILHDLWIAGPGATVLAVSGNNSSRAFNVLGGTAFISDLTITNGRVNGFTGATGSTPAGTGGPGGVALGGGIICQSTLTLSNCWITGNTAIGGSGGAGGADAFGSQAGNGGPGGVAEGGGVYNGAGTLNLVKCTISGNGVTGGTGGIGADASDNGTGVPGNGGAGAAGAGGAVANGSGAVIQTVGEGRWNGLKATISDPRG